MVRIVNRGPNDARLCQGIPVVAGASYRVSARVKTENVGLVTAGALIALEPRIADSADVKGTHDWQTLEVTATNPDQSTWDMCLRLGSYANLNIGTAWFTDVTVEQIGGAAPAEGGSRWPSLGLAAAVGRVSPDALAADRAPASVAGIAPRVRLRHHRPPSPREHCDGRTTRPTSRGGGRAMTTAQQFEARLRAGADETTAHELVHTVHEDRVVASAARVP